MAKPPRSSDLVTVLRGLARVGSAAVDVRSQEVTRVWATSSLRPAVLEGATKLQETLTTAIQQPQTLQRNASKGAGEALARISMVTEGLRAYRSSSVQSATEFPEKFEGEEDPLHDHRVEELNIEELLMQEASSGPALASFDPTSYDGLGMVQEEASNIIDKAKSTREEVSQRVEEFEPLLSIAKGEEKEITKEHLEILDKKVSELESFSHGHFFVAQEETTKENLNKDTDSFVCVKEPAEHTGEVIDPTSTSQQELSIENIMMHEAMNSHHDQLLSNSQMHLYNEVQGTANTVKNKFDEMGDEISQRVLGFEPLLDVSKVEKHEITEEDLEVINEKLSDLQDVAFGHNLKIFKEVENPRPVEEVLHDIVTNQTCDPKEIPKPQFKTEEQRCDTKEQSERTFDPAAADLENSISQVAKPVILEDSYTSTVKDVKVGIQMESTTEVSPIERLGSAEMETDEILSPSSVMPQSSKPTTIPPATVMSSAVAVGVTAAASSTLAAAVAAATPIASPDSLVTSPESSAVSAKPKPKLLGKKPLAKGKPKSTLAENAQARKVPHSRISRLVSFGGLAAGLGVGTLAEVTRRTLGLRQGKDGGSLLDSSPFLTEANAKRIVDTLCRVRGAALKLGQMLSIQDSAFINPQLQKIFERVRQSADFMPEWQLEAAIKGQLGDDWRSKVATFDEKPFAAASIGQVHLATLHDGRSVAMKIQYPGVAEGIESDINNLVSSLKVANIFPEGLFVDSVIEVAKRELRWECDYVREAECTRRFKELVKPYPELYVPEMIPELCAEQVFTTELIAGIPVDKCTEIDQESRNYISEQVLRVCLMELFQFGFMQTDPNWSNFFYDAETEQLALLDFGACREYSKDFVDKYINLIHGAAVKDRDKILKYSQELGFLTGYEAKVMVDAHIDAIMILGEAFQEDKPFNFGDQNTTYRIQNLVPVMLSHRMCAPPEESYSLHRKMSGVFLLCTKLNGVVNCHKLFHDIFRNYKFGGTWEDFHAGRL